MFDLTSLGALRKLSYFLNLVFYFNLIDLFSNMACNVFGANGLTNSIVRSFEDQQYLYMT